MSLLLPGGFSSQIFILLPLKTYSGIGVELFISRVLCVGYSTRLLPFRKHHLLLWQTFWSIIISGRLIHLLLCIVYCVLCIDFAEIFTSCSLTVPSPLHPSPHQFFDVNYLRSPTSIIKSSRVAAVTPFGDFSMMLTYELWLHVIQGFFFNYLRKIELPYHNFR